MWNNLGPEESVQEGNHAAKYYSSQITTANLHRQRLSRTRSSRKKYFIIRLLDSDERHGLPD